MAFTPTPSRVRLYATEQSEFSEHRKYAIVQYQLVLLSAQNSRHADFLGKLWTPAASTSTCSSPQKQTIARQA